MRLVIPPNSRFALPWHQTFYFACFGRDCRELSLLWQNWRFAHPAPGQIWRNARLALWQNWRTARIVFWKYWRNARPVLWQNWRNARPAFKQNWRNALPTFLFPQLVLQLLRDSRLVLL